MTTEWSIKNVVRSGRNETFEEVPPIEDVFQRGQGHALHIKRDAAISPADGYATMSWGKRKKLGIKRNLFPP